MKVSNGAICDAVSLSSFEGIPSGPAALWDPDWLIDCILHPLQLLFVKLEVLAHC